MHERDSLVENTDCDYSGGAGAGTGGLTWAQQFMRDVVLATGAPLAQFDLLVVCDLAPPRSVGGATDLVRRFVLRHPLC
jgi:hypothetical protein